MPENNKTITNMVGGEISPLLYGRVDIPLFQKAMARVENFITLPQGGARFRNGSMFVNYTRNNQLAVLIPFQFSDQQAYLIEATNRKFRFYKDNAVITETPVTVVSVTSASPCVVTATAHGYANGDHVYLDGVDGPDNLNGRFFVVSDKATDTFQLKDVFGTYINTTEAGTGGTAARVYEIATPYLEEDLTGLAWAQNADVMYIAHQYYEPRKLTRTGHAAWTLTTYTRTFTNSTDPAPVKAITSITKATPPVVTCTGHGFADNERINIDGVSGMTEVNGGSYLADYINVNSFSLKDLDGVDVPGAGYGSAGTGGHAISSLNCPRAVAFVDSARLMFGGSWNYPENIRGSKAPSAGTTNFDDFGVGATVAATDGINFTFAPIHGKADSIQWLASTSKFVVAGTFGSIRRLYGSLESEPLSATSFTAKSVNAFGCADVLPVSNGEALLYVQRGYKLVRSLDYDITVDGYTTTDRNLVADHLTRPGIKQIVEQQAVPDEIWAVRLDGKLLGLTYKATEDISGWHRHYLGGEHVSSSGATVSFAKVISIGTMPRPDNTDQVWLVCERVIDGNTVRSVEYIQDAPNFPLRRNFYKGERDDDDAAFLNVMYEAQKDAVHLDMASTYDGSALGLDAGATLTPGATTGTGVAFTASASVFTADMVGRQLWKAYDENGDGGGRAEITTFTSGTEVECEILSDFDTVTAIAAGQWFLTTDSVSGLEYLNGTPVAVLTDGGPHTDETVTDGAIALTRQASKVHVGLPYVGILETLNIDSGGVTGSAQAKPRSIVSTALTLDNTAGIYFGTDFYKLDKMVFRTTPVVMGRPVPLFSGIKKQAYSDTYTDYEKHFLIVQHNPLPCTVLALDLFMDTVDED